MGSPAMETDRLVGQFESLGDSCEFGLVQRGAGAEPLGLLRFAGFTGALDRRLEDLVAALDRGFVGLGDADTVQMTVAGEPGHQEYLVREATYGLQYHTFLSPTDVDGATLRKNESIRLRFLRRKLLADLASAEKIFIWKSNLPVEEARVQRLLAALRRHGPVRLLWVCAADVAPGRAGSVEKLSDSLLRGVIDRFASYETMTDIHHDAWFEICAAALRMAGTSTVSDDADRTIAMASLRDLVRRAEIEPSVGRIRGVSVLAPTGAYTRVKPILQDTAGLDAWRRDAFSNFYADQQQRYDEILKVVLESALVTSHGAVITQDGHLLNESCWEALASGIVPYGLTEIGDKAFRLSVPFTRSVRDPALLLKRPWWRNYRHWLVDAASLLAFASTRLDVVKLQLVIGREDDHALNAAMRELLAMLAPGARILEQPDNEVWRFSDLHYITPVHRPPAFILPEALSALHSRALAAIGAGLADTPADATADRPRRRLYLWHGVAERPRLDNEAAVIRMCGEFGFEVVTPQLLSMAERIAMFRDAEAVVGVKSPQLANIVFCQPSALVIALSPGDWPDPFHAELAGPGKLRFAEMFGPVLEARRETAPSDFRVDPDHLGRTLASLLPAATRRGIPQMASATAANALPQSSSAVAFEAFLPVVSYPDHQGDIYLDVLKRLHDTLRPRTYLEIGTQNGEALALADCRSIAVDPWMILTDETLSSRPGLTLFPMTSDAFFANNKPAKLLDGAVELAFLDGPRLHFDIILRDFMNVERCATAQSIVLIHDVVPPDIYMASRDRLDDFRRARSSHPMWWTGDVWKVIGVLQKYRPDLIVDVFDASPSGLAMVQRLDPASTTLSEHYHQIIQEITAWPSEEMAFAAYRSNLRLRSTADLPAILARRAALGADVRV